MKPGKTRLLKCPFCGKEKKVLSLASGNTIRGKQWSDTKSIYPMLPRISPIQKCPSCGKYYFANNVETREGEGFCMEKGNLTYRQLKNAAVQFGETLSKSDRDTLNMLLLWGYNDLYNREGVELEKASANEKAYIGRVLDELLDREDIDDVMRAEFLRERGCFDDALALLDKCHPKKEFLLGIVERMKEYAKDNNIIAFEIKRR